MSQSISDVFDIEPIPKKELPVAVVSEGTIDSDADLARDNLRGLIETANDALKEMLNIAVNSESPRSFEVVANLINTAADLNSRLLDTHGIQQKINGSKDLPMNATQNNTTTNNVIFNGTPAELSALLKANK